MAGGADRDESDEPLRAAPPSTDLTAEIAEVVGAPELVPVDADGVAVVTAGTVAWWVVFVVLLAFHGRLEDNGHGDWLWIALAGGVLGLYGVYYCRRRRDAIRRDREGLSPARGPRR